MILKICLVKKNCFYIDTVKEYSKKIQLLSWFRLQTRIINFSLDHLVYCIFNTSYLENFKSNLLTFKTFIFKHGNTWL